MEELIPLAPKVLEIGALGATCIILIWKGTERMRELTASITKLTEKIEKMTDATNARFNALEMDLRGMKMSVDTLTRRIEELLSINRRDVQ